MNTPASRSVCLGAVLGGLWWVAGLIGGDALAQSPPPPQPYDSKGKRDPFVPLVHEGRFVAVTGSGLAKDLPVSDLHLAGIVWDPAGSSLALINEMEVKIGDRLGDYQVVDIRPDAVILLKEGKPVVLQLPFEQPIPSQGERGGE